MKKHVDMEHGALLKRYVEKVNNHPKPSLVHEPTTKCSHVNPTVISRIFSFTNQLKKDHETKVVFLEKVMLYVIKGFLPMRTFESIWLHQMAYMLCPRVALPSKKMFVEEVLFTLMERTLMTYVQPTLATCLSTTCTFDLWMFAKVHNVFVVVNFLSNNWEPKHVTINLFKAIETNGATMAIKLRALLDKFFLTIFFCIC
jgi:hypothetical protein